MQKSRVLDLIRQTSKKKLAVLIDPEKCYGGRLVEFLEQLKKAQPDLIFVGGSQLRSSVEETVVQIKSATDIPVVLFIGDASQFTPKADAMLMLSLISGRNSEFLIGQHVRSSLQIKRSGIEAIPTGYILVSSGAETNVEKYSHTKSICDHQEVLATAIAGELLGMQAIYLEAGSGAKKPVSAELIRLVRQEMSLPLIVGGGIRSVEALRVACKAGADLIVVGNHFEDNPQDVLAFAEAIRGF